MSISLLGHAPSFLGEFSHDTTIVAPSFTFLNVVKSCDLVLFSWRKMPKKKKENAVLFKIFYLISPQQEHLENHKAVYGKIFIITRPRIYKIYFSLNYVVLCTSSSRPRPQLYDLDGKHHSGNSFFFLRIPATRFCS